ncbi:hypothetical protein LCGC14_2576120 [marine sediment metagenome]|uniref:Uncharacterized protein n=1 Tax=marine sediment metagenome TaxID=412755 RepID=A0A0F9B3R0_9ZZZZ
MTLVDDMFAKRPNKHPVHTAIETLTEPEDVLRFQTDYRTYMELEGFTAEIADRDIGYILGYYGEMERELWYGTLGIDHPIFGDRASLKEIEKKLNK